MNNYLDEARRSYLSEWEITSNYFFKMGYYDWCAKNINPNIKVLEIGVGIGNGTLSLLKRNCKIVAIEENDICLQKAHDNIKENNLSKIEFGTIWRADEIIFDNGKYDVVYSNIESFDASLIPLILIEGNFLNDTILKEWLKSNSKYDAIVCWFTGIHGAIRYNKDVEDVNQPSEYRKLLHKEIFNSAQHLLKENGVLNFCDRLLSLDEKGKTELVSDVSKTYKISENKLVFQESNFIDIPELNIENGIEHKHENDIELEQRLALFSLTYRYDETAAAHNMGLAKVGL